MEQLAANVMWAETLRRANSVIAPLNTEGGKTPIYWVHSVTGQGTDPINLAKALGPEQPFFSIRMPSKKRISESAASVEDVAGYYAGEIARFQPEGPLVIGAWSAGVTIALEMARQLKERGRDVRHLIAVDFAPHNSGVPANRVATMARRMANRLYEEATKRPYHRAVQRLLEKTKGAIQSGHPMDELIEKSGFTQTEGDFIRTLHDTVDAHVPRSYDGSVLFYVAVDGGKVMSNTNLHAGKMIQAWKFLAPDVKVSRIDGATHESLMRGKDTVALARRIEADLAETIAMPPRPGPASGAAPVA